MKTAFFIVFALAGVLFFSGCSRSGAEAELDSMRVRQDVEMVQYTEKHLLNAYARTGRGTELGRLFPSVFHGDLSSFHPGSASGFSDGDAKRRADIDADLYEVQFGGDCAQPGHQPSERQHGAVQAEEEAWSRQGNGPGYVHDEPEGMTNIK